MKIEPQHEHQWLQKLVGKWTYEGEAPTEPDKSSAKWKGTEIVRPLGGVWILAEGEGEMPDGGAATTLMTLGYDPQKKRYVGTFIGTMMTNLWVYEGSMDSSGKVLTLDTEGPHMRTEGKMAKYKDIIELQDDDHRVMRSQMLDDDGQWREIMTTNYRRIK